MSNIPSNDNRKQPISEEEYRRRQIRRRREIARKKRQRRNLFFAGCAAVVLVLIVGIILLCKSCSSDKPATTSGSISDSRIIGSYMLSDNSCTYIFKEDGSGYLQLSGGSQYNFTFSLADKTLKIDFESAAVSDSTYTVAFSDSGLTLTAVEGTITPDQEYILNRQ